MRLFVAVPLEPGMRQRADVAAADLRDRLRRARVRLDARWVDPANWHLTVRFIGHVPDDRAPALIAALSAPLPIESFELCLAGAGAFPASGAPRVFWIGVREGSAGLRALHERCDERLAPLGYAPEARPFSAHLTLARVKSVARGEGPAVRALLAETPAHLGCGRVSGATLFESRLSPHGAAYHPLTRLPFERL
ncbi:MAG TPA: RNA 2',3'-cyclic phosphodiesterase [Vicinamibacterales bacterium]|nr:RNA 2',3'-cyclic phosphodiesterase [Vicinamibacterales bacterium]